MSLLSALLAAALTFTPKAPPKGRVAVSVFDTALEQRLIAELAYLGYETVVVRPNAGPSDSLDLQAELQNAAAAISEAPGGDHLEIILLEPGRPPTQPIEIPSTGPNARDLAIRAAELVRVSLDRAQSSQTEQVHMVSHVDVPAPPEPVRYAVALGPVVVGSPGGLEASYHLRASVRYAPHKTYGIVLSGTAPLHPVLVTGQEGTADLWFGWVTLGPRFTFRRRDAVVRPEVGLGVGVFVLSAAGRPTAEYSARDEYLVTGIAEISGGLEFKATRHIRLRTMAALATCFTRPEVRFAGNLRAHTCLPIGLGEVAMTIAW